MGVGARTVAELIEICCVAGTRPEIIKLAPVILRLRRIPHVLVKVISTGQHDHMIRCTAAEFGVVSDVELETFRRGQPLEELVKRLLEGLGQIIGRLKPALTISVGDTASVLCTALISSSLGIPHVHVEAGLRTGKVTAPFPEEMFRRVVTSLSSLHLCTTRQACANLLCEGVSQVLVRHTGNTVLDALLMISCGKPLNLPIEFDGRKHILLTMHRRESHGAPMRSALEAVRCLVLNHEELHVDFSVHPNPNVVQVAKDVLGDQERVELHEPIPYREFVFLMRRSWLILSDSCGIQEEAALLGKPLLVLRNETERPETIDAGLAKLVGTSNEAIVCGVETLLQCEEAYKAMTNADRVAEVHREYGEGHAADRIVNAVMEFAGLSN